MVELGLWMSIVERERAHLVRQTLELCLGQREASERLGISVRQFKRLVQAWKKQGDAGVVSRQRGRVSNNRLAEGGAPGSRCF
jgi:transposase